MARVGVLLSVNSVSHRTPAVGAFKRACADILGHIEVRTFKVVAHHALEVVGRKRLHRLYPQRHGLALAFHYPRYVGVDLGLRGETAEICPHAGVAASERSCIGHGICQREVEVLVLAAEISLLAGEIDNIGRIDGVLILEREFVYACVVGMAAYVAFGNAAGNPHGALVGLSLADKLHHPHLVGIGYGERLARGGIAVVAHKARHHVDGLAGCLGALQGDVYQRAVVDYAAAFKLGATAPGALGYGEAMLVHIADGGICVGCLGNLAKELAGVPFHHRSHGACGVVGGRLAVQLAVERVAVGGICYDRAAVGGSAGSGNKARAG